jgi:hypothetical protein
MTMTGPQRLSGEAFAIERLREDPNLDYAQLRALAAAAGIGMQPIQYGRARKSLGLPPLHAQARVAAPAAPPQTDGARGATGAEVAGGSTSAAPRRPGSAAFEFLVSELQADPTLSYAHLRAAGEARGWKIAPVVYGRAKAKLGLVPVKPRGTGKRAAAAAAATAAPRSLTQVESAHGAKHLRRGDDRTGDQLVAIVQQLDAERRRLRALLERIVAMIDDALG